MLCPPLRQALEKGYANRSEVRREEGQAKPQQNRQEFPCIEFMPVRRLEQNGRGDVKQDADQEAVQGAERRRILRQSACKEDAGHRGQREDEHPRPSTHSRGHRRPEDGHEGNRHRELVQANPEKQGPPSPAMVVMMVVPCVVVTVVMGSRGHLVEAKGHRFNEGMKAEAGEGHGAEAIPVNMAVFHALAQVFQRDLNQESPDDPESSVTIRGKGFRKEVEKTESEEKSPAEGKEQRELASQSVSHGFSHGAAEDGDEKKDKSRHHEAWA